MSKKEYFQTTLLELVCSKLCVKSQNIYPTAFFCDTLIYLGDDLNVFWAVYLIQKQDSLMNQQQEQTYSKLVGIK